MSSNVIRVWFYLTLVIVCAALLGFAPAANALPPRPTPPPPDQPTSGSDDGSASVELHVHFSPMQLSDWQKVWTVVQWQDRQGDWHDVEGWRGSLDEIVAGEGKKTWWVYRQDLGKGPFRWQIHWGPVVVNSQLFHLPQVPGRTEIVGVSLAP